MSFPRSIMLATAGAVCASTLAFAQGQIEPGVQARHGLMDLMAFNIGIVVNMAKGNTPYDAATAQAAAKNLEELASTDWLLYWVPGTEHGAAEGSNALKEGFDDLPGIVKHKQDLLDAVSGLVAVAGNGADALGGAIGPVGGACGACHKAYRQPN